MKYKLIYIILIANIFVSCNATKSSIDINKTLNEKITEIEALQNYEFFVTHFPDSIQARFYNRINQKLTYHPYRYLRDTATIEELLKLTEWSNPFVRLYAFSSLEKREYNGLFQIILEHLNDTTEFYVRSDDHGWNSTTIDMMIYYAQKKLTNYEKDTLKHLIITEYSNIGWLDDIFLFFNPNEDYYNIVRNKAKKEQNVYSLIALSTYQKEKDISIIMQGFDNIEYERGVFIFFKAIENFPSDEFLPKLIKFAQNIKENSSVMDTYTYYYYALAKYQNKESLRILSKMTNRIYYSSDGYWYSNLIHIYKALEKYKCAKYKNLSAEILNTLNNIENKDFIYKLNMAYLNSDDSLENNTWNY